VDALFVPSELDLDADEPPARTWSTEDHGAWHRAAEVTGFSGPLPAIPGRR
jgi:hypothetical protein